MSKQILKENQENIEITNAIYNNMMCIKLES